MKINKYILPCTSHKQVKYLIPSFTPSCLPRVGSSHSTPSHVPVVPVTSPMYLTVPVCDITFRRAPGTGKWLAEETDMSAGDKRNEIKMRSQDHYDASFPRPATSPPVYLFWSSSLLCFARLSRERMLGRNLRCMSNSGLYAAARRAQAVTSHFMSTSASGLPPKQVREHLHERSLCSTGQPN
jgi:hypothetical protein